MEMKNQGWIIEQVDEERCLTPFSLLFLACLPMFDWFSPPNFSSKLLDAVPRQRDSHLLIFSSILSSSFPWQTLPTPVFSPSLFLSPGLYLFAATISRLSVLTPITHSPGVAPDLASEGKWNSSIWEVKSISVLGYLIIWILDRNSPFFVFQQ